MKAIVLAAGLGSRMLPLTNCLHKSLLPIAGSTTLGHIVDGLLAIDVRDIFVVTGYLSDQVRGFLREHYPDTPFTFIHNARYRETNNIVSLAMALDQVQYDSDIVLIESDVLFEPKLLRCLTTPERGNIALVDRYRPGMDGTVVSVEKGIITQVFPPHLQGKDFDYGDKYKTVNIYRFDREFCRMVLQPLLSCYANIIDSNCYYEVVLGMLINMQRETVRAETVDGRRWAEVDDPNDLAAARFAFEPESRGEILGRALGGHWNFGILDFTFPRNMYFPTTAVIAAMRRRLPDLVRSYGSSQEVLNEKVAYALKCNPERVECLHGAAQIFPLLPDLLHAARVLLPMPTFGEFPRWFPNHDIYTDVVGIDLDGVANCVKRYDVVVMVNANNPTGTMLPTAWIHRLAANHPHTTFLVDESFIAFSNQEALLYRLEREPLSNVLIIASLSKSLGVPGLRLGYVYSCNPVLMAQLRYRIPIWNLGSMAESFLETLPKFQRELAASFERSSDDRADFSKRLAAVDGVECVYGSGGNFLLVELAGGDPAIAGRIVQRLLACNSIYVKDVSSKFPVAAPYLRLAVRLPAENLQLIEALSDSLSSVEA
jgi:histidinol-phosphate/aromatic aminotransferase/cobyric acid decarboxylase-like protein/choline kinase